MQARSAHPGNGALCCHGRSSTMADLIIPMEISPLKRRHHRAVLADRFPTHVSSGMSEAAAASDGSTASPWPPEPPAGSSDSTGSRADCSSKPPSHSTKFNPHGSCLKTSRGDERARGLDGSVVISRCDESRRIDSRGGSLCRASRSYSPLWDRVVVRRIRHSTTIRVGRSLIVKPG